MRYAVQKVATNPQVREKAGKVARDVVEQSKDIVKEDDPAYAAGKAFRRALDNLKK